MSLINLEVLQVIALLCQTEASVGNGHAAYRYPENLKVIRVCQVELSECYKAKRKEPEVKNTHSDAEALLACMKEGK